jgi:hypothetical protein
LLTTWRGPAITLPGSVLDDGRDAPGHVTIVQRTVAFAHAAMDRVGRAVWLT